MTTVGWIKRGNGKRPPVSIDVGRGDAPGALHDGGHAGGAGEASDLHEIADRRVASMSRGVPRMPFTGPAGVQPDSLTLIVRAFR
jgi:hypothetical protein